MSSAVASCSAPCRAPAAKVFPTKSRVAVKDDAAQDPSTGSESRGPGSGRRKPSASKLAPRARWPVLSCSRFVKSSPRLCATAPRAPVQGRIRQHDLCRSSPTPSSAAAARRPISPPPCRYRRQRRSGSQQHGLVVAGSGACCPPRCPREGGCGRRRKIGLLGAVAVPARNTRTRSPSLSDR